MSVRYVRGHLVGRSYDVVHKRLRGTPSVRILVSPHSLEGLVQAGRSSLQSFSAGVYFSRKSVALRSTVSVDPWQTFH